MTDKCQHDSAVVHWESKGFSVLKCTQGCGEWLIEFHDADGLTSKVVPVVELKRLADERDALRARLDNLLFEIAKKAKR